jgi:hypothetical protein
MSPSDFALTPTSLNQLRQKASVFTSAAAKAPADKKATTDKTMVKSYEGQAATTELEGRKRV